MWWIFGVGLLDVTIHTPVDSTVGDEPSLVTESVPTRSRSLP